MDVITRDSEIRSGWQEIYTDFDSWICTFNKYVYRRSSQFMKQEIDEDVPRNVQIDVKSDRKYTSVEDLFVDGFILSKLKATSSFCFKKEPTHFLNVTKDGDGLVNYDYVILMLINGGRKYYYKYMKSKL